MTITILGSGTPVPSRTQAGTAILIEAAGRVLLIDCGRGCTSRLAEYQPGLLTQTNTVFLTHLHSDHVVGLPDLWLNGWTQGRDAPFRIWGPEGTGALMDGLRTAYGADISIRTSQPGSVPPGAETHELPSEGGVIFDEAGLRVTTFPVKHAGMPAFGYRVEAGDASVMISGDTTATPALAAAGQGADVVMLEVLSPAMVTYLDGTFPPEVAAAIRGLHLTAEQAGEVFRETEPVLGVYYHTVASCRTDGPLLAETGKVWPGQVAVSRDLMQVRISADGVETIYPESAGMPCR